MSKHRMENSMHPGHEDGCGRRAHRFTHHRGYGGRHGRGWGRGGRRILDQGDLRFVILTLIAEKPRHGYDIIKAVGDQLGGAYAPSPGVVYPTLQMLEEQGYVALQAEEGAKKLYALTPEGRAFLDENADAVAATMKRMDFARERYAGGPPPQIVRAMENLRLALRLRLERGEITEERAAEIAAAIDAAAAVAEKR
ncbi:MAG: PadR family transcriptional regulator [Hydrogenophilaceae bacterium]|nr:PadR family transcriptional regulator [Hydrogenophilaceae bacterium]